MRPTLFVPIALLALACAEAAPASIQEAARLAGCEVQALDTAQADIFNSMSATCAGDARVYWFPTAEANRNHAVICAQAGGQKVAGGSNWTKYSPSC